MAVRLLRGDFFKLDGFAIQDFEALPIGPVQVPVPAYGLVDLFSGASLNGGCKLDYAILLPREQ
jgi:hypothetical protein